MAQVGERQQRLLRELEKLALEGDSAADARLAGEASSGPTGEAAGDGAGATPAARRVSAEEIELRTANSAEWRAYALADALVGRRRGAALLTYVRLRAQGERASGLTYVIAQRLREALAVAVQAAGGRARGRGAALAADALARRRAARRGRVAPPSPSASRAALGALADFELDCRGGSPLASARGALAGMSEDTLAVRTIEAIGR